MMGEERAMEPPSISASDASTHTSSGLDILEIFDLEQLQALQDRFADATGVASFITRPDGMPVTRPSNFCRLCIDVIRPTEKGFAACMKSDAVVGGPNADGPIVRKCLSGGLWDAGASISVHGEHVANWLIGQVRTSEADDPEMLAFAHEIGADETEFSAALAEVPRMSEHRFRLIADFLFSMADQLSTSAYRNVEKTRLLAVERENAAALAESESRLHAAQAVAHVGSWIWDLRTDRVEWSDEMSRILGLETSSFSGNPAEAAGRSAHPEDRAAVRECLLAAMLGETPYPLEYRVVRPDGTERTVWTEPGKLEHDAEGKPARLTGVISDITERKQGELLLRETNERLESVFMSITKTMGNIVEARDPYTQGHEQGVAKLSRMIAEKMGFAGDEVDGIEVASLVHDIGKLSVPAEILVKPGRLSEAEFALIKTHSQAGHDILKDIDFDWPVADIVLQHHERMDGSGYPNGLVGDNILMAARILAVSDVVEAMASHRPYRSSLGLDVAIAEVVGNPSKFDSRVVAACVWLYEEGLIDL